MNEIKYSFNFLIKLGEQSPKLCDYSSKFGKYLKNDAYFFKYDIYKDTGNEPNYIPTLT